MCFYYFVFLIRNNGRSCCWYEQRKGKYSVALRKTAGGKREGGRMNDFFRGKGRLKFAKTVALINSLQSLKHFKLKLNP